MKCANCGTDVIQEQKFCRQCGALVADSDAPATLPEAVNAKVTGVADSPQRNADTSRHMKPDAIPASTVTSETRVFSDAFGNQNQTTDFRSAKTTSPTGKSVNAYDTTPPEAKPPSHFNTQSLAHRQSLPSRNVLFITGGVALLLIIALTLFFTRSTESSKRTISIPAKPSTPEIPTSSEAFLPEEMAIVNDEETIVTAKFPLIASAKFSLNNLRGDVTIEGTDDTSASVKVIKKGGTSAERKEVKIGFSTIGNNLILKSPSIIPSNIDLAYEIKLPRSLGQARVEVVSSKVKVTDIDALVDIKSVSGAIELAKIKGGITANTQSGDITLSQASGDITITSSSGKIELNEVNGANIKTNNTQGDTRAIINSTATSADALTFESVSGDIDVKFKSEINAELDAGTVSGTIDVQGLGIQVKRAPGSATAAGRVGIGGQPLKIKTTSGNIKVTKKV